MRRPTEVDSPRKRAILIFRPKADPPPEVAAELREDRLRAVSDIEIGWHTKRASSNRGFATEAARACKDLAFGRFGLSRLISIIDPSNVASRRVAEKIGMSPEKTVMHDGYPCVIYAIDRP